MKVNLHSYFFILLVLPLAFSSPGIANSTTKKAGCVGNRCTFVGALRDSLIHSVPFVVWTSVGAWAKLAGPSGSELLESGEPSGWKKMSPSTIAATTFALVFLNALKTTVDLVPKAERAKALADAIAKYSVYAAAGSAAYILSGNGMAIPVIAAFGVTELLSNGDNSLMDYVRDVIKYPAEKFLGNIYR